ncbi:heat-inducible transcriptional repressor [Sphaerisporangium rubeum]|uniref:Heat-inducible transcription repressor HrcA n=1 Tax=Sphaerisporangium rubeum TaxID=321317 RepID=A0A7X0IHJ4_9ACTN|nr:heat-inducible transcriptional repressor [Sphaerisporangium rubeum]
MSTLLDDRKLAVLRAVVEDYVSTNEPVGSKALAERHNLGVSPATVRNDMAVLEEQGYIAQPHTSAGRVPTDKGYRLFVDRLSQIKPLSAAERRAIETFLAGAVDLDDVVTRTVRLLAQLTRQVAVVQYPSLIRSTVRHVELVPLSERRIMLVLITNTGRVEQRVVDLPDVVEDDRIAHLRAVLNAGLDGCALSQVPETVADMHERLPEDDRPMAGTITSVLLETLVDRHEEKIVFAGTANLTADFTVGLRDVLEALEEQVVLMRLLGEAGGSPVTVRIGSENPYSGLHGTSIVAAGYGSGDNELARLGVLGPTRMDYPVTMGAVRAVARYVGQILAGS